MNNKIYLCFFASIALTGCDPAGTSTGSHDQDNGHAHEHIHAHANEVQLTTLQFSSLQMKIKPVAIRNLTAFVEANGQLEVPPQSEAAVTAIIGANITAIKVTEGDKVMKGQVLAFLSHPDLIRLQTNYSTNWSQLQYMEKEYARQKHLFEEKVVPDKTFRKTEADYLSLKAVVKGYEAQLELMGLNVQNIQRANLYQQVPVLCPIEGYIRKVKVKIGQYVTPEYELFEIVNNERVHADLMVFEKDMHRVQVGQKVLLTIGAVENTELQATIYAVGKAFEQNPKAIHLHADIENKKKWFIPGTYVKGRIITERKAQFAVPEEGIVRHGDRSYVFIAKEDPENNRWKFKPAEVTPGNTHDGWVGITFIKPVSATTRVAWNNAYKLMAEMRKEEAEHSH